jgi:SRSO17 transposase
MKPLAWNARLWKESVTQFLEFLNPLIAGLGRSERRVAATRYVEGLLMPGNASRSFPWRSGWAWTRNVCSSS